MAGLIQRGNTWVAVWWQNETKQIRKSTRVHVKPTARDNGMTAKQLKALAQRVADGMEGTARANVSLELAVSAVRASAVGCSVKPITVSEFSKTFLDARKERKSFNNSKTAVESLLRLMPACADLPLARFTAGMAEDYIRACLDEVGGSTINRRVSELSTMFNRAVKDRLIESNPFCGCIVPKWAVNESKEREPFTREELQRILTDLPNEWPDMVAVCMLLGGLRLSNVATLEWASIDFERGLVKVTALKTNKGMTKPLIKPLRALLERRRAVGGEWSQYVFPYAQLRYAEAGDKSSKLSIEFTELLIKHGIIERAPVEEKKAGKARRFNSKTFHSLRTTATTFLLDCGCPAELVRHIVGHDDPNIERAHYYKPQSEVQGGYMAKLADMLGLQDS